MEFLPKAMKKLRRSFPEVLERYSLRTI